MSTVYLAVGQCGNQLGFQFWKLLKEELAPCDDTAFNRDTEKARFVMVDSEPKVVEQPFAKRSHPLYEALNYDRVVSSSSGTGNNWAMGFNEPSGDSLCAQTLECLRQEIECCDYYKGTVMLHSIAGGTGSGLGSKLLRSVKEEFPVGFLSNCSVFPSEAGDSPLQDYNSCFALSYLQEYSDFIFFFENDIVLTQVQHFTKNSVSTHNLNEFIASALVNALYPERAKDIQYDSLIDLVPSDCYKFIESYSLPFAIDHNPCLPKGASWALLNDTLIKKFPKRGRRVDPSPLCLGVNITMRGGDAHTGGLDSYRRALGNLFRPVPWAENSYMKLKYVAEGPFSKYRADRSLVVTANRTSILYSLKKLLSSAKGKFDAGAYLHWFKRYGCEESEFLNSFECLKGLIAGYTGAMWTT